MQEIDEDDIDLELESALKESQPTQDDDYHHVYIDIESLSKKEKLDYLKKDAPEVGRFIKQFKHLMKEANGKLKKFLSYSNCDDLYLFRKSASFRLCQAKYQCIVRYCTNICFYMSLKSSLTPLKSHPLIEALTKFKNMLLKIQALEKSCFISEQLKLFWIKINANERIELKVKTEKRKMKTKEDKSVKRVHFDEMLDFRSMSADGDYSDEYGEEENKEEEKEEEKEEAEGLGLRLESKKIKPKRKLKEYEKEYGDLREESEDEEEFNLFMGDEDEEMDEEDKELMKALDNEIAQNLVENEDEDEDDMEEEKEDKNLQESDEDEDMKLEEKVVKRPINYQIAKNKGLTPKRKKEYRNPRVKHRNKYRRAKIRRKGAVREVQKEIHKYAGEISGIKSDTVKSVKYK